MAYPWWGNLPVHIISHLVNLITVISFLLALSLRFCDFGARRGEGGGGWWLGGWLGRRYCGFQVTGLIEGVVRVLPEIKCKTKLVLRLFLLPGNFYGSEIWHGFFGGLNSGPGFFV